jgi:hypothetical protein
MFFGVLEGLPQIFSHFDCQRRNLFIRKNENENDELILVDWALCGFGPLGAELYSLVGMSCALGEWPSSEVVHLDNAAFEGYLQGLGEVGWSGKMEVVRLGFVAWQALWLGARMPYALAWWCSTEHRMYALQQFGMAEEELYLNWIPLLSFSLDCADEARNLMKMTRFI